MTRGFADTTCGNPTFRQAPPRHGGIQVESAERVRCDAVLRAGRGLGILGGVAANPRMLVVTGRARKGPHDAVDDAGFMRGGVPPRSAARARPAGRAASSACVRAPERGHGQTAGEDQAGGRERAGGPPAR